jgi:hypothetical protein
MQGTRSQDIAGSIKKNKLLSIGLKMEGLIKKQYKIIPSITSLLLSDLRPGYMFRYQVPSSGLNIKIT